ncbi:MAG TPA: GxxExxY protein [Stellaceae bacterium]|nr:GxxExxY protein [Stellaceae bacterium]
MPSPAPITERLATLAREAVDAAFRVHSALGPGLLESVYETCLRHDLKRRGLNLRQQVAVPIIYDGLQLDAGLRLDLLIEEELVVEVKAIERILPVHEAQLLSYLKLARNGSADQFQCRADQRRKGASRFEKSSCLFFVSSCLCG